MTAFAIGVQLSMIGLPPTMGFVSKWFMLGGAGATSNWFAVAVIVDIDGAERRLFRADPDHGLS